jgi:hypothetical protein
MGRLLSACLLGFVLLPLPVGAAGGDFAMQWPLELAGDGADDIHAVQLDESVYRNVQAADLRDLAVVDAEGALLPTAVLGAAAERHSEPVPVRWFALPATRGRGGGDRDWQLVARTDGDGRLGRVEVRSRDGAPVRTVGDSLLLDLADVGATVVALELAWEPAHDLDLGYRVEHSTDLEHWRAQPSRGRLVDLRRDGHRLLQRRIELPGGVGAGYLRLSPQSDGASVRITGVEAVLAPANRAAPDWLELQPVAGGSGRNGFEYRLPGRFPIRQVDVAVAGSHVAQWRLASRDAGDAAWHPRVGPWVAYRLDASGSRSDPRVLARPVRDRHWRLQGDADMATPPVLRLGYRPETVVFLAQGPAPYRLVAGSAAALPRSTPLPRLLATLRAQHGEHWQPPHAVLGPPQVLAGEAALAPARDWKSWLLWGVLGAGALLVASLGLQVLRSPGAAAD